MTGSAINLSQRLHRATREQHQALKKLEFFEVLQKDTLPRQSAVSYLRGLAVIHALLSSAMAGTKADDPVFKQGDRLDDLLATLDCAGASDLPDITRVVDAAIDLGDSLLLRSGDPICLLGACYVLESSQMGGEILQHHLAVALDLQPDQIFCFRDTDALVQHQWDTFRHRLDELELTQSQVESLVATARMTVEGIGTLAGTAWPFDPDQLRHRVSAINPEAGRHSMPEREADIARALRCGAAAWQRFPYLEMRYGDRGRRFTSSDSCWLISLYDLDEPVVVKNLLWLRGVLSSRGLPTVILEDHLGKIDDDIAAEDPQRWQAATGIRATLEHFRQERFSHVSEQRYLDLIHLWQQRFDACPGKHVPDAARLLVGARLDTDSGIVHAWEQTRSWFCKPELFSDQWLATVAELADDLERKLIS